MTAVEVRVAGGARCPRCGERLCLTASIGGVQGNRTVALCPVCDAADPHAQRLIGYFAAHESVLPQDMAHVSELLGHWLSSISERVTPEPSLAAQAEAWWAARSAAPSAG